MASDDELSTLERSLLDEEYGGEEAPEVEEQVHGDIQEKVVDKPLVEPHVRHPAEGEIHFLVDEIQERLDREMERVLFTLQHPLAGKRVRLLTVFVRAVVQAYARQMGKIANVSEQQLVEPITPVLPLPERIPVVPHVSAGGVIPPPPVASAKGLTFPEIPHEEPYQLSALDQETAGAEPEERRVNVIHIPLMLDEERNEIVAAAEYDEEENVYRVHEPELDEHNHAVLMQLKKDISDVALLKNQRALQKQITKSAKKIGVGIDDEDYFVLKYYLVRDLAYFGLVTPLLNDPKIMAITCEGQGIPLTIIREGKKIKTTMMFASKDELNQFLRHAAKMTFQTISIDDPVLDATYKNFRIQGTLGTDIVPSRFLMKRMVV